MRRSQIVAGDHLHVFAQVVACNDLAAAVWHIAFILTVSGMWTFGLCGFFAVKSNDSAYQCIPASLRSSASFTVRSN